MKVIKFILTVILACISQVKADAFGEYFTNAHCEAMIYPSGMGKIYGVESYYTSFEGTFWDKQIDGESCVFKSTISGGGKGKSTNFVTRYYVNIKVDVHPELAVVGVTRLIREDGNYELSDYYTGSTKDVNGNINLLKDEIYYKEGGIDVNINTFGVLKDLATKEEMEAMGIDGAYAMDEYVSKLPDTWSEDPNIPIYIIIDTKENHAAKMYGREMKFATNEITLKQNEIHKIAVQFEPQDVNRDLHWESSDPSVVSVDYYGRIKALKPGEATITATTLKPTITNQYSDYVKTLTASCKITVIDEMADFNDNPDGINDVEAGKQNGKAIYTINGKRLDKEPEKGIYVKDGKKVVR